MSVLVTGGAGFIGSHLVEKLISSQEKVFVLDDLSGTSNYNFLQELGCESLEIIKGSISDKKIVTNLMSRVSQCYHLAASLGVQRITTNPISSLENNIRGTEIILNEAAKFNVRTIFASTSEIYGKNINVPLTENSDRVLGQTNIARWTYSESKAINEFYALELFQKGEFPVTIVRFFNTVGPRQSEHYGMVMPRFINSALRNEPIIVYGDGKQTRSFCAVTDAVSAIQLLMTNSASIGEVYNLGSDTEISILELANLVLALTNSNSKIVYIEQAEVFGNNFEEPRRRVPDISKIIQAIDWRPTSEITDIILQIVSYIKSSSHPIK